MPELQATSFGQLLRGYRVRAGLSQEQLAERAELSVRGLRNLELGTRRSPYPRTLRILAEVLGLHGAEYTAFMAASDRGQAQAVPSRGGSDAPAPPVPLTPLIGRERLLEEIVGRLTRDRARLLTLTGIGGVGKTCLSLAVAAAARPAYRNGVVVVELAEIQDRAQVLPAIARRLGLDDTGRSPLPAELVSHLRERQLLLVLDNLEHLAAVATELVTILEACPDLALLVTSRVRLGVRGELELMIEPLAVPALDSTPDPEILKDVAAVRLFVERALGQVPAFRLTRQNAGAVADICRLLDGLPLAIELAAARMRLFTAQQLRARLDRRLPLLVGGPHDLPDRQRTMRATVAWSYQLLNSAEQALFQRLAVFAGGCTVDAVQAVCGPEHLALESDLLLWLEALLNHHLLQREEALGMVRLTMLQTVREYAREQLVAGGGEGEAVARHAAYFLDLAEQKPLQGSPEQTAWHSQLDLENDNLRAALAWCLAAPEEAPPHAALRFAVALDHFWRTRGYVSEGRSWLARVLEQEGEDPPGLRARVYIAAAYMGWLQGELESATALAGTGLRLAMHAGDRGVSARAHNTLAAIVSSKGNFVEAQEHGERALALYRADGTEHQVAMQLNNLGNIAMRTGDAARALPLLEECVSLCERLGHRSLLAAALGNLGTATGQLGDLARAGSLLHRAMALFKEQGDEQNSATVLWSLGKIAFQRGDLSGAGALLAESVTTFDRLGSQEDTILALELLAAVLTAQGEARTAALLLGAANAGRATTGAQRPAVEQSAYEACYSATTAALEAHEFAGAWAAGEARTLRAAVQVAVDARANAPAASPISQLCR